MQYVWAEFAKRRELTKPSKAARLNARHAQVTSEIIKIKDQVNKRVIIRANNRGHKTHKEDT